MSQEALTIKRTREWLIWHFNQALCVVSLKWETETSEQLIINEQQLNNPFVEEIIEVPDHIQDKTRKIWNYKKSKVLKPVLSAI